MGLTAPAAEPPGLPARRVGAEILDHVLRRGRPLDEKLEGHAGLARLDPRDRALARHLVATALRRLGSLRHLLAERLRGGFPRDAAIVEPALLLGATQILWLDVPDHAAVDLSVRLVQSDRRGARYTGLVNAVLRGIARERRDPGTAHDTPDWLMARWRRTYGDSVAQAIAAANGREPALDLSVVSDSEHWAAALEGRVLPGGTVRTPLHGAIAQLPGFAEGAWWVQDAAAALPVRLLGDVRGRKVADLCAAPGGKTAQLAAAGARVTAVDLSPKRLERVRQNLDRLHLSADVVAADATQWEGGPFDAVLLDAPCSATGTIRRHPDIPWLKREGDIAALAVAQRRLLAHAATLLKPGGVLVYCTCSLEPDECEDVVGDLLARELRLTRRPVLASEIDGRAELISARGDLRTLPCHLPDTDERMAGMDGFYAARLSLVA